MLIRGPRVKPGLGMDLRVPCDGRAVVAAGGPGNIPGWATHRSATPSPGPLRLPPDLTIDRHALAHRGVTLRPTP